VHADTTHARLSAPQVEPSTDCPRLDRSASARGEHQAIGRPGAARLLHPGAHALLRLTLVGGRACFNEKVLLSWDNTECRGPYCARSRSTFAVNVTGWSRGLEVTGGGRGVVSHAGLALLRHLADKTGLTGGLSAALATARVLVHDRGRVVADLACAIADGARVISDFRVMSNQGELFGLVASVPTA
jgi:hypothetical protein